MLTIKEVKDRYIISVILKDGKEYIRTSTADIEKVHNSIRHYFGEQDHQDCNTPANCPLCRWESK